jgi:mannose-6-phosphate isomerase-like protein (cupin superfamily)
VLLHGAGHAIGFPSRPETRGGRYSGRVAGYSVRNLRELKDSAAEHGLSPDLEARFARDELDSQQLGISLQRLAPGVRAPFAHRHGTDEELYVITAGGGRAKLGDDLVELRPWDVVRVAPETVRAFEAGADGLELIAVGPRGSDDAEPLPASWPE